MQLARERLEADAGLDAHARAVGVEHAVEAVEREQRALGDRSGAERVPGTGDAHRAGALSDRPRQLGTRERALEAPGPRALGTGPVDPLHADARYRPLMDVGAERVAELQREGSIQLIDIREPYEWEAGRIPGARFLTMGELSAQAETIHRDTPVVFYCRVGGRSAMAANAFRRAGYDAYTMSGGLVEWEARGLPLEPDGGHVADH